MAQALRNVAIQKHNLSLSLLKNMNTRSVVTVVNRNQIPAPVLAANTSRKSWRDSSAETKFSLRSNTPPTLSERNLASASKITSTVEPKQVLNSNTVLHKKESNETPVPKSPSCPAFKLPETTQPTTNNDITYNIPKTQSENSTQQKPFERPGFDLLSSCSACPPPCCGPCGPCCGNPADCNCGAQLPPPCNTPPKCLQHMAGYYYYPYGTWFCGPYHVGLDCAVPCSCCKAGPCCCGLASCGICSNAGFSSDTSDPSKEADAKTPPSCGESNSKAGNTPAQADSTPRSPRCKGSDLLQASTMSCMNSSWGLPASGNPQAFETSRTPGASPSSDKPSNAAYRTSEFNLPHCAAWFAHNPSYSTWGFPQTSEASEAKTSPGSRCGLPNCSKCSPQTAKYYKYHGNQASSHKSKDSHSVVYPPNTADTLSSKQDTRHTSQDQIVEKPQSNQCKCSECASRKVVTFLNKSKTVEKSAGGAAEDTTLAWRGINSGLVSVDLKVPQAKKSEEVAERPNYCEMLRDPKYTVS